MSRAAPASVPARTQRGAAPPPLAPAWWRGALAGELALAAGAGLLALLAAAVVLQLWRASPAIPLGYGGDGMWTMQVVKGIVDHGWLLHNPDVGAPFGQELHEFTGALGDNLHFAVIKAMSLVSQDPVKLVNGYFLLGFLLCAASACLVLRRLGVSRAAAVVAAVLFSQLPVHAGGGLGRLMLGAYWSIPLIALLLMRVFEGEPLFARRASGARLTRWASGRSLATAALCFLIAGSGLYYALFCVMLLLLAAVAVALVRRDWRATLGGGVAAGLVLAIFVVHISPSILYTRAHGSNEALLVRGAQDSNSYSTNLALLVSPVLEHRWEPAREFARRLDAGKPAPGPNENSLSALGLAASLGFLGLLFVAVVPGARWARERAAPAAASALLCFLLGTTGGIGLLVALLVTPDLRGWGRIAPLLGFLGLFAVALAYDHLRARTAGAVAWRRYGVLALLPVVLVVGVADQTTDNMVPRYDEVRTEFVSDARFVADIDQRLPADAAVVQLPAAPFPEAGRIAGMYDYSHMRGPLHADALRFSYGAIKGRPSGDWATHIATLPLERQLPYYTAAGFRGVWVDRRGFQDYGVEINRRLRALLPDAQPIASGDDALRFYSLARYAREWGAGRTAAQRAAARDGALHVTDMQLGSGTRPIPGGRSPQIADPVAGGSLTLRNPGRLPRTIRVLGRLQTHEGPADVDARVPGRRQRLRATAVGRLFSVRLRLAPGQRADLRLTAPRARGSLQIPELLVADEALEPR